MAPDDISTDSRLHQLFTAPTSFKVIAVQTYGGAGSLFLHSLFDDHPNILVLPGTLGVQYYVSWANVARHTRDQDLTYGFIKKFVMSFFSIVYDAEAGKFLALDVVGKDMNEAAVVDKATFEKAFDLLFERLSKEAELPPKNAISATNVHRYRAICLKSVYLAHAFCLGHDLSKKDFLLYPAHGSPIEDIRALCEDFNDVRFVHMVREPVSNLDSVQRRLVATERLADPWMDLWVDPFWCVINHIYYDRAPNAPACGVPMHQIYPYPVASPERYIALRLEDLHGTPEKTLKSLCRWLGVPWSETLLQSTFCGKTWWNLPGLRRVTGFSTAMTGRKPHFGRFDQWRLRLLGAPIGVALHYAGYRRNAAKEWLGLMLSLVVPFGLEAPSFRFVRYKHLVTRHWPRKVPGRSALAPVLVSIGFPFLVVFDFFKHRVAIGQGFFLNRSPRTKFVPVLEVGS